MQSKTRPQPIKVSLIRANYTLLNMQNQTQFNFRLNNYSMEFCNDHKKITFPPSSSLLPAFVWDDDNHGEGNEVGEGEEDG